MNSRNYRHRIAIHQRMDAYKHNNQLQAIVKIGPGPLTYQRARKFYILARETDKPLKRAAMRRYGRKLHKIYKTKYR